MTTMIEFDADLLRSLRTLTQEEVDQRTARHDAEDLRPFERLPIETETVRH